MPTDWTQSRARPTDVAAEKEEIDHFLNDGNTVSVLGQTHGPTGDGRFAFVQHLARGFNQGLVQSRIVDDPLPVDVLASHRQGIETAGGRIDESRVHCAVRNGQVLQCLEERGVTADTDRQVQIGQLIVKQIHAHVVLRVLEPLESSLRKRVHVDDARSVALRISK